jgi:glycosyltransferase involved in cell wall biosynthesis
MQSDASYSIARIECALLPLDAVIPVFNEPTDSILVTVNALNAQTHDLQSIVLVDDASNIPPDYSLVIAQSRIPIQLIRLEVNSRISSARNHGARYCSGTFLLFVNCEVQLSPYWTERGVDFLATHREAGLACGQIFRREQTLRSHWRRQFFGNRQTWTDATQDIDWALGYAVNIFCQCRWVERTN